MSYPVYYSKNLSLVVKSLKALNGWNVFEYWVFSGPYFPVLVLNTEIYEFSPSTGKNETEKSPYSDGLNALTIHTNHDYETHE